MQTASWSPTSTRNARIPLLSSYVDFWILKTPGRSWWKWHHPCDIIRWRRAFWDSRVKRRGKSWFGVTWELWKYKLLTRSLPLNDYWPGRADTRGRSSFVSLELECLQLWITCKYAEKRVIWMSSWALIFQICTYPGKVYVEDTLLFWKDDLFRRIWSCGPEQWFYLLLKNIYNSLIPAIDAWDKCVFWHSKTIFKFQWFNAAMLLVHTL